MPFNISYIGLLALFPNDFLVQALSLTASNATRFKNGNLLAQEILPNPQVSTLPPSSMCQVELDSYFSGKNITENPTDTVIQFVQNYCEPHAQFLSSKTLDLFNFLVELVQPYFCLYAGTNILQLIAKGVTNPTAGFCSALEAKESPFLIR